MLSFMREAVAAGMETLSSRRAAGTDDVALPRDDMLAQGMLSTALTEVAYRVDPDVNRLRALIALDRSAQSLLQRLHGDYCVAVFQASPAEAQLRQALQGLSGSFARAYYGFVRQLREKGGDEECIALLPYLVVRYCVHCETELFVASLNYERWPQNRQRQLNATFQFVLAHGLADQRVACERSSTTMRRVTPEQAYLRVLLLRLIDTTAMTPREIALAAQWIGKWTTRATLRRMGASAPLADEGFAIDLSGSDALVRAPVDNDVLRPLFHLDPTPIVAAIDRKLAKIGAARDDTGAVSSEAKIALLAQLKRSLAPGAEPIRRRDERFSAALTTVEALPGKLTDVFRVLRDEARRAAQESSEFAYSDAVTLGQTIAATPINVDAARLNVWRVRDCSESGLRLFGSRTAAQDLIPGSLVVTRVDAQWTLYVVRWLTRRVGANFEVGIERLGTPNCVVVCPMNDDGEPNLQKSHRRPALFLQDDGAPAEIRRSLVLSAEDYVPGRILTVLSRTSETTIRLGDPIEQKRGFVRAPVEVLRARTRLH